MEWIKIRVTTKPSAIEILSGLLINLGIQGMIIEDDKEMHEFFESQKGTWDYIDEELENRNREDAFVEFFVSDNIHGKETITSVKSGLIVLKETMTDVDLGSLELEIENVNDKDWLNNWKKYYKTFQLGENIVIKPCWEEYENKDNKVVFEIEPGYAFGTGLHQTTQLCIVNLEKYVDKESVVLDLGTGTGILSIISMLIGADKAYAIDIDPNATKTAEENAIMNKVNMDKYNTYSGNISTDEKLQSTIEKRKYNIVVANIVADVIISIKDFVKDVLIDDGVFISSGIIDDRENDVKNELINSGYEIIDITRKEGWVSIIAKLKR